MPNLKDLNDSRISFPTPIPLTWAAKK
jgi:hypothetical protein